MTEEEILLLFAIVIGIVLVSILFFQHILLIKFKNNNAVLKGVVDKLTSENIKLIEELYESNINK